MSSGDTFADWRGRRHAAMQTPPTTIARQLRISVRAEVIGLERLIVGEDNEVYAATTATGSQLIVRISHVTDPRFEGERWALDAARTAGVPTPRVLDIARTTDGVTFCIEQRLPGTALDVLLERGRRPDRAIAQLGELLGAIHSIRVDGFGYLQPDGRAGAGSFVDIMTDLTTRSERLQAAAQRWQLDADRIEDGLTQLAEHRHLYHHRTAQLVHGDFSLDHILIDGPPGHEYVSGIIDMQDCAGGHPVSDLAYWYAVSHDRVPLKALLQSYPDGGTVWRTQRPLLALIMLRRALWMLIVEHDRDNAATVADHVAGIDQALALLR